MRSTLSEWRWPLTSPVALELSTCKDHRYQTPGPRRQFARPTHPRFDLLVGQGLPVGI